MSSYNDCPDFLRSFLNYHSTVKGHSHLTTDEYYLDLRTFLRFLMQQKGYVPKEQEFDKIDIRGADLDLIKDVTLLDVYDFLNFLSTVRKAPNMRDQRRGMAASSRARKITAIRSFYKYLNVKAGLLTVNPVQDLDSPKVLKSLPRYLSLEESRHLLASVEGRNRARDYAILMIFLNCGLRISELVALNKTSIQEDRMTVLGKGNKERTVYLNDATLSAIKDYLVERNAIVGADPHALFLSARKTRISRFAVNDLVKKHLGEAGLDQTKYSAHKLRHTAATLLLHNGVDVRTLQELLGHENLNTTEIYTHIENEDLRKAAKLSPLADLDAPEEETLEEDFLPHLEDEEE